MSKSSERKGTRGRALALSLTLCVLMPGTTHVLAQRKAKAAAAIASKKATAPKKVAAGTSATRAIIIIKTQPGAIVWVDEVRRGAADAEGLLKLPNVAAGRHAVRVRASGFQERTLALLPAQRGIVEVRLMPTTDEAELLFQQAEESREKAGGAQQSAELYRQALKLRPRFAAARVGLARALMALDDHDGALAEIAAARRARPAYAEASAIEGRVLRGLGDPEAAIESYRRAIREGRGFQPEAYTGLGIVLEDKGEHEEAVGAFRKAVAQLSDTEPVLYELLGRNYEKLEKWKEAASAYEKYLELAPEGSHASAIRSIIEQLQRQAAEQEQETTPDD
ncbi:MAG: tetratricopeptide repeat protein [Acidobacteria bacterium]|nr:tetratricopeptide repeat protein [Acidobacteriota bacterium]